MNDLLKSLKEKIIEVASNPNFIHHDWFVKYHLEIGEKIALELLEIYSKADRDTVLAMMWMHDYGKMLDFANQYQMTQEKGLGLMREVGFSDEFSQKIIDYIKILDNKMNEDLHSAPIEVQIVASADAASHFVGPFFSLWWYENASKPFEELMADNLKKVAKDWDRKMVLPEIRDAFAKRRELVQEQCGVFPDKFLIDYLK